LDRNLSQVKWIFLLTLVVMACGFAFILFGLYRAFDDPAKLNVAMVSSASGVIISFIGGSFLLVYRSILASAKDYVTVLERINAVGMAVQVIGNIPDASTELKQGAMADLAKQLLSLYGTNPLHASGFDPVQRS
jgi:nitrate reductase gamma subunit